VDQETLRPAALAARAFPGGPDSVLCTIGGQETTVDYRTNVRAVRALADGQEAFWDVIRETPGFDGASFGEFARRNLLFSWIGPVLEDDAFRGLLPADLLELADARRAAARRRNLALLDVSKQLVVVFNAAGIESLFLKGLVFAERFYGDVDRRHQMDVDVLVRPAAMENALAVLAEAGFDTIVDRESGKPMHERLERIRRPGRRRVPHALGVRRGEVDVDLHWCLRSRALAPRQEESLWAHCSEASLAGTPVRTLSKEHTLMFLLLSIASDIKRGACRAKHFLDLHLFLHRLEREIDWDGFFVSRSKEGLLRLCVNVLAVFAVVWDCAEEFGGLRRALEQQRHLVDLRDKAEAVILLERPRGNRENRVWRRRVYPRSRWAGVASRWTLDLPYTLSRLARRRRFSGRLVSSGPECPGGESAAGKPS
jgi:hypothetical protein